MTELLENRHSSPCAEEELGQFLADIRGIPKLSSQQERELARRCAMGDEEAIRRMVTTNLRLVVSVAREYSGRGVALMDLIQEGSIGLLTAARKFDHTLDYRFSTYATKWIRQGITRYLMNHNGLIRVPEHTAERIRHIRRAAVALWQETGEEPTAAALAQRTGIPEEKLRELMLLEPQVCSLDLPVGDEDSGTLGNLIEDEWNLQPQQALVRRELEHTMEVLLGTLDPRQNRILRLHFGMDDGVRHSLEDIGKQLGISRERVRQLERQAMDALQKKGASMGLEDFLE